MAAERLWVPLAVAGIESVTESVELEMAVMVVPAGIPAPATVWPTLNPVMA